MMFFFFIEITIKGICVKKFIYDNKRKINKRGKKYKIWVVDVLALHGAVCDICDAEEHITAHHLNSWKYFPELRYEVSNGIPLCKMCHQIFHCDYLDSYRAKAVEKDYNEFKKIAIYYSK